MCYVCPQHRHTAVNICASACMEICHLYIYIIAQVIAGCILHRCSFQLQEVDSAGASHLPYTILYRPSSISLKVRDFYFFFGGDFLLRVIISYGFFFIFWQGLGERVNESKVGRNVPPARCWTASTGLWRILSSLICPFSAFYRTSCRLILCLSRIAFGVLL